MKDIEYWYREIQDCKKLNNQNNLVLVDKTKLSSILDNIIEKQEIINIKSNYTDLNKNIKVLEKDETLGIDRNTDKKLKSGNIKIDLKLDFHGLTLNEAFDNLIYSVNNAYNNNLRCLLIITGKGKNTKQGRESIKSCFEKWMKHDLISNKIIKYTEASKKDGGSGAIYILLKRNKIKNDNY